MDFSYLAFFERGSMMRNFVVSVAVAVAFLFLASVSSASVTEVSPGKSVKCANASWVIFNNSEDSDTTVVFDIGAWGYSWGKTMKRVIAPGGYQAGSIARLTTVENKGPGNIAVNCQHRGGDFTHDWKMDAGSMKTYQPDYLQDHVTPGTYIEPGLGQPEGTERGIFGTQGTGDGGTVGERWR